VPTQRHPATNHVWVQNLSTLHQNGDGGRCFQCLPEWLCKDQDCTQHSLSRSRGGKQGSGNNSGGKISREHLDSHGNGLLSSDLEGEVGLPVHKIGEIGTNDQTGVLCAHVASRRVPRIRDRNTSNIVRGHLHTIRGGTPSVEGLEHVSSRLSAIWADQSTKSPSRCEERIVSPGQKPPGQTERESSDGERHMDRTTDC